MLEVRTTYKSSVSGGSRRHLQSFRHATSGLRAPAIKHIKLQRDEDYNKVCIRDASASGHLRR